MSSRREREKDERRRYILSKAQSLFAQKGYLSTSMAEIAQASEFAVGSLYTFFNSKEEILATIFADHIEVLLAKNEHIRSDPRLNAREKIEASLDALVHIYVENQDFFRIYVAEARGVEWGVRTEVGQYIYQGSERYLKVLAEMIRAAIKEGFIDEKLDPEFVALLLRSFIHSTASHFLYGGRNVSVDSLLTMAKRILFNGIRPPNEN
jgi:AcrR family transcriptional regulator